MNNLLSIIYKVLHNYSWEIRIPLNKQYFIWFKELTNHFLSCWSIPGFLGRFSISTSTGPEGTEGVANTVDLTPQAFGHKL